MVHVAVRVFLELLGAACAAKVVGFSTMRNVGSGMRSIDSHATNRIFRHSSNTPRIDETSREGRFVQIGPN
jgi:hypothetical protein